MTSPNPRPEFNRLVKLDALDSGRLHRDIEADERERELLARRFGLVSLDRLRASLTLDRVSGGPLVRVEGRLEADVVQHCTVTLGPVAGHVEDSFSELYGPTDFKAGSVEEDEIPEPFDGNAIDTGELVAQHFSLALDPYPRAPGAELPAPDGDADGSSRRNPFAVLARPRKKR